MADSKREARPGASDSRASRYRCITTAGIRSHLMITRHVPVPRVMMPHSALSFNRHSTHPMCKKNSPCKYASALKRYLTDLESKGNLVPDSGQAPGCPNLSEIARDAGIPYRHLRQTPELQDLISVAAAQLGVGQRPPDLRSRDLRRQVTYGELIEAAMHSDISAAWPTGRYRSALARFMKHYRKIPEDPVGPELSHPDEGGIKKFLGSGAGSQPSVDRSALRFWRREWMTLSSLEYLPNDFNQSLRLLVEAANVSNAQIARATGINPKQLWEYVHTGKRPLRSPRHVESLEQYFGLPANTLLNMLRLTAGVSLTDLVDRQWVKNLYPAEHNLVQKALPDNYSLLPANQQKAVFEEAVERIRRQPPKQPYMLLAAARTKAPYVLHRRDWPSRVEQEFRRLVESVGQPIKEHKPSASVFETAKQRRQNSVGNSDPNGFLGHKPVRGQPKRWSPKTIKAYEDMFGSFLGYLRLRDGEATMPPFERPVGQDDFTARRYGLPIEELSIGLIGVDELLMDFLTFRCFERGTGYNNSTLHTMSCLQGLIQRSHGWIRYQPDIARHVETLCATRDLGGASEKRVELFSQLCDGAIDSLDQAREKILEETPDSTIDLVARDVFDPVLPILNKTSPKSIIEEALALARRDLPTAQHVDSAVAWRDRIYIRLLAETGLRGHHFPNLRWGKVANHGCLYEEEVDGQCRIVMRIPRHEFKNARFLTERGAWRKIMPDDLAGEIRYYLHSMRPLFNPTSVQDHLFLSDSGTPLVDKSLRKRFIDFTERYLSPYSPVGLQIDGVKPFSPHALRQILAVDIFLKTGSYRDVADFLVNTEVVARRTYAVLSLEQRIGLVDSR